MLKLRFALVFLGIVGVSAYSSADVVIYSTRTEFEQAHTNLSIEDFEEMNVADGGFATFTGPLDELTDNGIFSPGDIVADLAVEDVTGSGHGGDPMIALGADFLGSGTTKMVGSRYSDGTFDGVTDVFFYNEVANAVGIDVFAARSATGFATGTLTVSVGTDPNSGPNDIGSWEIDLDGTNGGFFGIFTNSSETIGRIRFDFSNVNGQDPQVEFVDNVAFGITAVPEPSGAAVLAAVAVASFFSRRKRQHEICG